MTKYQERIDDEIGTPPPSTVDVDAIVTRQRRWVRAQRAGVLAAAGFVAAVLVTGVGVLQHAGGVRSPDQVAAPSPSASPTDPRQAEAARLTAALRPILEQMLPAAQFLPDPQDDGPSGAALVYVDRGTYFQATAQIRDAAGLGSLRVTTGDLVTVFGTTTCSTDPAPLDVKLSCDSIPGPDGSSVMRLTVTRKKFTRYFILVQRTDGVGVGVEITNGIANFVVKRPTPPLTRDQAVSLAEQPSLASTVH